MCYVGVASAVRLHQRCLHILIDRRCLCAEDCDGGKHLRERWNCETGGRGRRNVNHDEKQKTRHLKLCFTYLFAKKQFQSRRTQKSQIHTLDHATKQRDSRYRCNLQDLCIGALTTPSQPSASITIDTKTGP